MQLICLLWFKNFKMAENTPTIRKTITKVFQNLPEYFNAPVLCRKVNKERKKFAMDGTILRRLRELRNDGVLDYRVITPSESLYQKIETI